jgi:hypothetical protein
VARSQKHPWRNTIVTLAVLGPVVAAVIYNSFQVSDYECSVCITFFGRESCRTVNAKTEKEGIAAAIDNACATLASGVTETMRCQRTTPTKASCRSLVAGGSERPTLGTF